MKTTFLLCATLLPLAASVQKLVATNLLKTYAATMNALLAPKEETLALLRASYNRPN